jgi:hypothetical protein
MNLSRNISIVALGLSLVACSNNKKAPDNIEDSFASELNENQQLISITRDALGKEFLLQGNIITQMEAPSFENMKSRVVIF